MARESLCAVLILVSERGATTRKRFGCVDFPETIFFVCGRVC